MNKLPISVTLLSVVVAVVLWYVATLLERDRSWLDTTERSTAAQAFGPKAEETPVLGGVAALDCQSTERELQAQVDDSRYCTTDDDCTIFDFGYPIQCMTSVSKDEITALRLEYRKYEASCAYRVYYDCPSAPAERVPVCRNSRCEVALETNEFLKRETLEHLGIKSDE